jgi:glycosyltransferase involved in cell wall biosynthesis
VNRFFHPDHSATSQILSDLAFHLAALGFPVKVIASRGLYDDPNAVLPQREEVRGVDIYRVVTPRFGRSSIAGRAIDYLNMYRAFAQAAARIARKGDLLVAKTDPPLLSVALAPVAKAKSLKLINWLQDLYPEVALGLGMRALAPLAPILVAVRNASLRAARMNVAIGELMAQRVAIAHVGTEKRMVTANWCDDQSIRPLSAEENPLRSAWELGDRFVVGYSGNLGRAHEYATILTAAEILRDRNDILFLFVGGGHLLAQLKKEVSARGLDHRFQFRPYQDFAALPQSLAAPDVHWLSLDPAMEGLIVPSKFYGIAAAGKPTIAVTAVDGEIARLVREFDCGIQVTPGDGQALADQILSLHAAPDRLAEMGANGRRMIDDHFSRTHSFAAWERLLKTAEGVTASGTDGKQG